MKVKELIWVLGNMDEKLDVLIQQGSNLRPLKKEHVKVDRDTKIRLYTDEGESFDAQVGFVIITTWSA